MDFKMSLSARIASDYTVEIMITRNEKFPPAIDLPRVIGTYSLPESFIMLIDASACLIQKA